MARADLNVRLGLVIRDFERDLKRVERRLNRAARNFSSLGRDLTAGLTVPIAGAAAASLQAAAQFEQLTNALIAVTGSTEEAQAQLERLREIAEAPGIGFEEAVAASLQFQGLGVSANNAEEAIRQVANAVAASGGGQQAFAGVVRQLNQIQAKNRVLQEDISILLENAPILGNVLQDTFGSKTAEGIREAGINGEQFFEQLVQGLSKLERVQGSLANTFENFGIAVRFALADIGQQINDLFDVQGNIDRFVDRINDAIDVFRGLDDETKRSIVRFAAFVAAVGPAIFITGRFAGVISVLIGFNRQIVATLGKWVASFFTYTVSAQAAEVATKRFNTALKFTFAGIALTAITLIVVKFLEWRNALRESRAEILRVSTAAETFKSVTDEANESIAGQVVQINRFVSVAQDETRSQEERVAAIQKLKKEYPKYFSNVSEDLTQTDKLTIAKERLIASLLRQAQATAAQAKIEELATKQLKIAEEADKLRTKQQEVKNTLAAKGLTIAQAIAKSEKDAARTSKLNAEAQTAALFSEEQRIQDLVNEYKNLGNEINGLTVDVFNLTSQAEDLADKFIINPAVEQDGTGTSNTGGEGDTTGIKKVTEALKEYRDELELVDKKAQAFGTSIDEQINQKADITRKAIEALISAGLEPTDEAVVRLINSLRLLEFQKRGEEAAAYGTSLVGAANSTRDFINQANDINGALPGIASSFESLANGILNFANGAQKAGEGIEKIKLTAQEINEILKEAIEDGGFDLFLQKFSELSGVSQETALFVSDQLSAAFSGFFQIIVDKGKNAFQAFIKVLENLLVELLTVLATAIALAAVFSIFTGGATFGTLFTGFLSAQGALGGLLSGIFKGAPGAAQGGIVPNGYPNDTYIARLSSQEAIIPLDRLNSMSFGGPVEVTGTFLLEGNNLVAAVERNQYNRSRTRGR